MRRIFSKSRSSFFPATLITAMVVLVASISACKSRSPSNEVALVEIGEQLFFNETFAGNGRTCGTCHRPTDNFGLTTALIATLPDDDPLFVAETNPALASNFENPKLMRLYGLILENQDGFGDLKNNFNQRGVPHILAMKTSINSTSGPRTGWSGDGAPGDGSLRSFATGAVIQHFTKTTNRIAGTDFRLPTDEELDALEAFQLSLGRQHELALPLPLKNPVARRGQEIFMDNKKGKCNACHFNAGANADPALFGAGAGNLNFNTGVENLPDQPADLTGELVPDDDGFGHPGIGEFNTPTLVEAADTGPFFHNNSVESIEAAVAFYNGDTFTNSPAGQLIIGATGSAINLEVTQVIAVAAFLRVLNVMENTRSGISLLDKELSKSYDPKNADNAQLDRAYSELEDAVEVLTTGGLHPYAALELVSTLKLIEHARDTIEGEIRSKYITDAIAALKQTNTIFSEL